MKKYLSPDMEVNNFSIEEIMTSGGGLINGGTGGESESTESGAPTNIDVLG